MIILSYMLRSSCNDVVLLLYMNIATEIWKDLSEKFVKSNNSVNQFKSF